MLISKPTYNVFTHIDTPTAEPITQGDRQLVRSSWGKSDMLRDTATLGEPEIELATFWLQVNLLHLLSRADTVCPFLRAGGSELNDSAVGYFITACVVIFLAILAYIALPKMVCPVFNHTRPPSVNDPTAMAQRASPRCSDDGVAASRRGMQLNRCCRGDSC